MESTDNPPQRLEINSLPAVEDFGFTGGRQSFRAFCEAAFRPGTPRFMRNADGNLVIFRHKDVRALAVRPEVGAVPPGVQFSHITDFSTIEPGTIGGGLAEVLKNQIFTMNPPTHTILRKILTAQVGAKSIEELKELASKVVDGILSELEGRDEVDLSRDVAEKLTARFWGAVLGMTPEETEDMVAHVQGLSPMFHVLHTFEEIAQADAAALRYGQTISTAVSRSLASGGCPMAERVAAGLDKVDCPDDPYRNGMVPKDAGAFFSGNLVDGFHTAALGATNAIYVLVQNIEALGGLPIAPEMISSAIREALRVEPPAILLNRLVLEDFVYDGMLIPKDTVIAMMWGAANHDPEVFPDPTRFDINRSSRELTTFGGGIHICAGLHAALMLIQTLVERLLNGDLDIEFTSEVEWMENYLMCQMKAAPLRITRRAI